MRSGVAIAVLALLGALLPTAIAGPAQAAPVDDLVIAGGRDDVGDYLLIPGQPATRPAYGLLTDTANFGPTGTVQMSSLTIDAPVAVATPAYLAGVDVFFDGWVFDSTHTEGPQWDETSPVTSELDALEAWVSAGGVLIANEDSVDADELGSVFGVSVAGSVCCNTGTYVPVAGSHPIVDGPFGTWSSVDNAGTVGHFGAVGGAWTVVARDSPSGNATIITRPYGAGQVILTGDEGIFRTNMVTGENETFVLNLFAWAHCLTDSAEAFAIDIVQPGAQSTRLGAGGSFAVQTTGGKCSDGTFSATGLPTGLSIDPATGVISGTTTATGTSQVTVTASTTTGTSDSATFDWTVAPNLWPVAVDDVLSGTVGQPFSADLCSNDTLGDGAHTTSPSGTMPPGLTLAGCTLSGTPTVAGDHEFTYLLSDADPDQSLTPATVSVSVTPVFCSGAQATIVGTSGDDVLVGTPGPDVIHGLGGNDIIHGLGGRDIICGGGGADEIHGNGGRDTIDGNKGADRIFGGGKADVINGGGGRDEIDGNKGADVISGGKKADILRGNGGADELSGGAGSDTCVGGAGPDTRRSCEN